MAATKLEVGGSARSPWTAAQLRGKPAKRRAHAQQQLAMHRRNAARYRQDLKKLRKGNSGRSWDEQRRKIDYAEAHLRRSETLAKRFGKLLAGKSRALGSGRKRGGGGGGRASGSMRINIPKKRSTLPKKKGRGKGGAKGKGGES